MSLSMKSLIFCFSLFIFSCGVQNKKNNSVNSETRVTAKILNSPQRQYFEASKNRLEARGWLHTIIYEITKFDNIIPIDDYCFPDGFLSVELIIEKPKGEVIRNSEILKIIKDSFGYVIEKQDFWIEKMNLVLIDSIKLKAVIGITQCTNQADHFEPNDCYLKVKDTPDSVFLSSTLRNCITYPLGSVYKDHYTDFIDSMTKSRIEKQNIKRLQLHDYKIYKNEILPFDVKVKSIKSFGTFLNFYCGKIVIPTNIATSIANLKKFYDEMGILLTVKIEKKNYHVIRCQKPLKG